jgi:hypothetical protein
LSRLSPPIIAVRLDLDKPGERTAHELVQRFGSGRWPLWRIFGIRRHGNALLLAVQWMRGSGHREFSVASVSLVETAVQWSSVPSALMARRALDGAGRDPGGHH